MKIQYTFLKVEYVLVLIKDLMVHSSPIQTGNQAKPDLTDDFQSTKPH